MANLDTREKRSSGTHVLSPWRGLLPLPDATIGQADRQHIALMYSGILFTSVAEALLALKYPTFELESPIGMTLMPVGNVLQITTATQTPTAAPPGNKGVVFKISGGVLTIYVWDGSAWRSHP